MRGLPEPMDGAGAHRPRSTDDTAVIPPIDHDNLGWHEREVLARAEQKTPPAWPPVAGTQTTSPPRRLAAVAPQLDMERVSRHRAAQDDLPGPSRRELARMIRQVRALVIAAPGATVATYYLSRPLVELITR
jgi:hypothetical protein